MGLFGTIAGAVIGKALSSDPKKDLRPGYDAAAAVRGAIPISAGGLSATLGPGGFSVGSTLARANQPAFIRKTLRNEIRFLNNAAKQVRPGMGRLTAARLGAIENARARTVGNLSDTLARRRVLGSSFGQDAVARAEAEFAQKSAEAAAKGFMEEWALTQELQTRKFQRNRQVFETTLGEMNLQADFGLKVQQTGLAALSNAAQISSQLSQAQAGITGSNNEFIGGIVKTAVDYLPF